MIESATAVRRVMIALASASWVAAFCFLSAAAYADMTIPADQLNESMLGYVMSAVLALTGWAFLGVSRIYRRGRVSPTTRELDSEDGRGF
jgi:hypothetical protein